jgi:6-phosphogluconolactonase (cycloisomerase 2 family)
MQFDNPVIGWIDERLPIFTLLNREYGRFPTPRNFNLIPDGKLLLAAGQLSNSLGLFSVDANTGRITFQQTSVFVPTPICVLFDRGE